MNIFLRTRFLRRWIPGVLSLICVLILAACGTLGPNASTSQLLKNSPNSSLGVPVLKVATGSHFPPFAFTDEETGELKGFDIDLINAMGKSEGFSVQLENTELMDELIRDLYAESVDAAIYAISITSERAKVVSFSRPYFRAGLAIAVQADNTEITSAASLAEKEVGVESGTTGEAKAEAIQGARVRKFDTAPLALQELAKGNIDAVINDAPATEYQINSRLVDGVKLTDDLLTEEYYGIAIPKSSAHLEPINAGLTKLFEDGTYDEIYQKWFRNEPPQLPEAAPI